MKEDRIGWSVYDDGLKVWDDGELVAVIKPEQFV